MDCKEDNDCDNNMMTTMVVIMMIIGMVMLIINNYWMRLSMMSRIIQTEVKVIFRSRKLRRITLTEVWIILGIMRKPNPIIVLLYVQKQSVAVKRLMRLILQNFVIL